MSKQKSCRASHGRAENNGRWGLGLALVAVAVLAACGGGGGGGDTPQPQQPAQFTVTCPDGSSQTAATEAAAKDKCAPARILSISPGNGESVPVNAFAGITFVMDGLLDPASTVSSSAKVSAPDGSTVPATVTPSADGKAFTVSWAAKPVLYTLVVTIKDSAGHGVQLTTTVGVAPEDVLHYPSTRLVSRSGSRTGFELSAIDSQFNKVAIVNKTGENLYGFEAGPKLADGRVLMQALTFGKPGKTVVSVDLMKYEVSVYTGKVPADAVFVFTKYNGPHYPNWAAEDDGGDGTTCHGGGGGVPNPFDLICEAAGKVVKTIPGTLDDGNIVSVTRYAN